MRPPGPAAFHFVNVYADFSRQATDVRRGGRGRAMLGPRYLAQLLRHGERFRRRSLRLIRQKHLGFGFSLGLNGRLNRQAGFVLFGNVLDRSMLRLFGCADAPPSRVKITWPTFTFWPSLT